MHTSRSVPVGEAPQSQGRVREMTTDGRASPTGTLRDVVHRHLDKAVLIEVDDPPSLRM